MLKLNEIVWKDRRSIPQKMQNLHILLDDAGPTKTLAHKWWFPYMFQAPFVIHYDSTQPVLAWLVTKAMKQEQYAIVLVAY